MDKLVFATHNENKVAEVASILKGNFHVVSLAQMGINGEIDEPFDTIIENAKEKARVVNQMIHTSCFSEDTGLEVSALNGEPGVKSARYAGNERNFEANIDKLLSKLDGINMRDARFLTIICLIKNGKEYLFEGECKGIITGERRGSGGFGYDSIFVPEGSKKTFAEMSLDEKNEFSHRKKAIDKLVKFLEKH